MGELQPPPSKFDARTGEIAVAGRMVRIGGPKPKLREGEELLTYTVSLCPYCQRLLPAVVFERSGAVWIRRVCPEHGEIEELYYSDAEMFKRFARYSEEGRGTKAYVPASAPCPFSCGLCPRHRNHTALANIVLTNRCDLSCWYCFFYADKMGYVYEPSIEEIRSMVRSLRRQGVTMAVQLTGGEPTLRDDLPEIVRMLREEGVTHVQLNTHGIRFAKIWFEEGPEAAAEYARRLRRAGVNTVYLSFDGVTPRTNPKNHWEVPFTLDAFRRGGMTSVVLVPTVIRGYNDHELGDIVRFAAKHMDIVRGVNFQPVSLTGMIRDAERRKLRVTIPDVIKWIEEQTNGQIPRSAWYPVPVAAKFSYFLAALTGEDHFCMANHPACGAATYVYVERGPDGLPKRFIPITEFLDVEGFIEYMEEKTLELMEKGFAGRTGFRRMLGLARIGLDIAKFIDVRRLPPGLDFKKLLFNVIVKRDYKALGDVHYTLLFLGIMHFMDQYNYDVARVMRCNIHYLVPDGRLIPFCAFNVLNEFYRDYVQREYSVPIEEWEAKTGRRVVEEKYVRAKYWKIIRESPVYWSAYEGIVPREKLLTPR